MSKPEVIVNGVRRDGPEWETNKPRYAMPPLACDAHVHVYGPAERFPFSPRHLHLAFDAPKEALASMHAAIGVERCVIVHAAVHATDLGVTLDALAAGAGRYRAVAIADNTASDARLEQLHVAGVRGLRYNFVPHLGGPPDVDELRRMAARIAPLGWHVVVHMKAEDILTFRDVLKSLPAPVLFDHMARVDASRGTGQAPFLCLLDFLAEGQWVKIAAIEKLSRLAYPFEDSVALGAALIEAAPDRVIWGTDWPHPLVAAKRTNDGDLVDLIPLLAREPARQQKLLVDNPARLYGFE